MFTNKLAAARQMASRGAKRLAVVGILALGAGGYTWMNAMLIVGDPGSTGCSSNQISYCQGYCDGAGKTYDGCAIGNSGDAYCMCKAK